MPTYNFTDRKTGKTHNVPMPEGSTKEQAFARLQGELAKGTQFRQTGAAPAAAPVDSPAADETKGFLGQPKRPVDASGTIINSVGRIPKAGKLSGALVTNPKKDFDLWGVGMADVQNYADAAGAAAHSYARQLKKLGPTIGEFLQVDNPATAARLGGPDFAANRARLDEETKEARRIDESLGETKAGMAGEFVTDAAVSVPFTALSGGLISPAYSQLAKIGPKAGKLFGPLSRAVSTDVAAGAGQGLAHETTQDESALENAAKEGIISGLIPGVQHGAKKLLQALPAGANALLPSKVRGLIGTFGEADAAHEAALKQRTKDTAEDWKNWRTETIAQTREAARHEKILNTAQAVDQKRIVAEARTAALDALGQNIGVAGKWFKLPVTPAVNREAGHFASRYPELVDSDKSLKQLLDTLGKPGGWKIAGERATGIRSQLIAKAKALQANKKYDQALQLFELQRSVDDEIYKQLHPNDADFLKQTWSDYGSVSKGAFDPAPAPPVTLTTRIPKPVDRPMPIHPHTLPYSRSKKAALMTNALRAGFMPVDNEEY